ncbi:MAG: alanine--tRNA ligase-related protein [Candidatus Micrarchaeota archaeon]
MEKIYERDAYESKFVARVADIVEKGGRIHVTLDSTAFFPGGGGQESDTGTLDSGAGLAQVVNVYEKDGNIWHECELSGSFSSGQKVEGIVNWERRYSMMKSHTAEHILFHSLKETFKNIQMVKVHITPEGASIILQRNDELSMDGVIEAEKLANSVVSKGLPVTIKEYKKEELPEGVRAKLERIETDDVRVVHIGDFDLCACAGLHVKNTGEIGILTVSNISREGTGQHKVSFLVGADAQEYLLQTKLACERACIILQTTSDKLDKTAGNLRAEKERLEQAVKSLNERILDELNPAKIGNYHFYSKLLSGMDSKKLMAKAGELIKTGRTIVLFGNRDGEKGFLVIAKSPDTFVNIKTIADNAFEKMGGKGGGPDNFLTGAGDGKKLGEAFGGAEEELTEKLIS